MYTPPRTSHQSARRIRLFPWRYEYMHVFWQRGAFGFIAKNQYYYFSTENSSIRKTRGSETRVSAVGCSNISHRCYFGIHSPETQTAILLYINLLPETKRARRHDACDARASRLPPRPNKTTCATKFPAWQQTRR